MYEAKILLDSISPQGYRLTTFQVTMPRIVLAEFNTHRMLSRNSASSRAIPVAKSIQAVKDDPFVPEVFGKNQTGMVADENLDGIQDAEARGFWSIAIDDALWAAQGFDDIGVHKSLANRILEPYKWHTVVVTATDWDNFFALRCAKDAQPEIRKPALMMEEAMKRSEPQELTSDQRHIPLLHPDEDPSDNGEFWTRIGIARCARVSYLTHDGRRDLQADLNLYERLRNSTPPHLSPFEHVARPFNTDEWEIINDTQTSLIESRDYYDDETNLIDYLLTRLEYRGNLHGWFPARSEIPDEDNASLLCSTVS